MDILTCALALLSGVIGAGFASGREIDRFFAGHGAMSGAAILCALLTLHALFIRLPAQLERAGVSSLSGLCRVRFGRAMGLALTMLFVLLSAITGGAMLSACAELGALVLPTRHAYGLCMGFTLALGAVLAFLGIPGLAAAGAGLCALLPVLLLRLLSLPAGEACFLPAMTPDLPVRACVDGAAYGALNAAMLAGALPMLLTLKPGRRRKASLLFCALFGALLLLGTLVCRHHRQAIALMPLPFVYLSRALGAGGYTLVALCMYAAALSTLCTMLCALARCLPLPRPTSLALGAVACLLFAMIGFGRIVQSGYPVLGALCAALMLLLCLPLPTSSFAPQEASQSSR